jgi:ribosomal-protein-alanine N-acetyltransferase
MDVKIRRLREEDAAALSVIEAEAFSMPWHAEDFLRMVREADALYLVAEENGKVLGSAGMRIILEEGDIDNVVVAKEARGRGIGKALLAELLREGKQAGCTAFTLEVRAGNAPAIALYEGAGFVSEGIRPGFYDLPKEDAIIYWKR